MSDTLYSGKLPEVFPFCLELPKGLVRRCVEELLLIPRSYAANGTSFAVTSDAKSSWAKLWLSLASIQYLATQKFLVPRVAKQFQEAIDKAWEEAKHE